jgi:hypothetical protein
MILKIQVSATASVKKEVPSISSERNGGAENTAERNILPAPLLPEKA